MKLLPNPLWLLLAVALASCGEEKKAAAGAQSGGEVLEGSISDSMIPLETVRSQAPLAPRAATDGDDKRGSAGDGKAERKGAPRAAADDGDAQSASADQSAGPGSGQGSAAVTPGEE